MEIPKNLQKEIVAMQKKLINAIREHQICMDQLKKNSNNSDIRDQIQKIQLYIVSLGRCQKQIVEQLRKEVQPFMADNPNGLKVSIASLLGLNNNNHITNNNETKHEAATNGFETKPSKERYDEVIRNGDVASRMQHNDYAKQGPSSVETISGEDDIVEVPMDENSNEKQEEIRLSMDENSNEKQEEVQKDEDPNEMQKKTRKEYEKGEQTELEDFLCCLGLITKMRAMELQNRRAERKRRSTANPQFVYSMLDLPAKRQKRHSYLQSGNAPHTRQTTARMNGPSPPPNKAQRITKSTSPPIRTKSLIPVQKSTTRPNILRNADSKVFVNKNKIEDNQTRTSVPSAKPIQIGSKAVHIPGLPSSLTIERIENDSSVCISCRNPGTLMICQSCSSNYHVTCHTRSPAPLRTCPQCVLITHEEKDVQKNDGIDSETGMEEENKLPRLKKNEKLAAATLTPRTIGKAGEDSEIYKKTGGLYKIDANEKKCIFPTTFDINQLPASTFLIPITSTNSSIANQSEGNRFSTIINTDQRQDDVSRNPVIFSQYQQANITYVQRSEDQMPYACQLPITSIQPDKRQSYLIVKKITESGPRRSDQSTGDNQTNDQGRSTVVNYQLPTTSSCASPFETGVVFAHSLFFGRNNRRKQTSPRTIPALHRIINSEGFLPVANNCQLDRTTLNGRKPWTKFSRGKLCINQQSVARPATETLFSSYADIESNDEQLQITRTVGFAEKITDGRGGKYRSTRAGTIIHSLFPGNNKPYIITNRARDQSRGFGSNNRDCPLLRQQLCRPEHEQFESHKQPNKSTPPTTVQLHQHALTRFFGNVKLEEAHIPAPPRTKLVHKNKITLERDKLDISENFICKDAHDRGYENDSARGDNVGTALLTPSSNSDKDSLDGGETKQNRWTTNDIEASGNSYDNSSKNCLSLCPTNVSSLTHSELNCVNAQSSALIFQSATRFENDRGCGTLRSSDGTPHIAQNNLPELRNEVSVPEDKADTERQDLSSGGRQSSTSSNSSSAGSGVRGDANGSSGHSDTPKQAMNDDLSLSHT